MLEKAYAQKQNDPYITDSIGWAYYLIGDYVEAEKLLRRRFKLCLTTQSLMIIMETYFGN